MPLLNYPPALPLDVVAEDPRQLPLPPGQPPPPPQGAAALDPEVNEDFFEDGVSPLTTSEWNTLPDGGECRGHIGELDDSYYYGVEVDRGDGADVPTYWTGPFPTEAAAQRAMDRETNQLFGLDNIGASLTEVRALDWWEDQRANVLDGPGSAEDKAAGVAALGPEPSDDAKVWLDANGERVEQPAVEVQPIEVERPETEERADREEMPLGLAQEDPEIGLEWEDLEICR